MFVGIFGTGISGSIASRDGRSVRVGGTGGEPLPAVLLELDRLLLLLQSLFRLRTFIKGVFKFGLTADATSSPMRVIESAEKRLVVVEEPFPLEALVVSSSATGSKGLDL
jgi:hypothetical protein